jgi:hypothetical protein
VPEAFSLRNKAITPVASATAAARTNTRLTASMNVVTAACCWSGGRVASTAVFSSPLFVGRTGGAGEVGRRRRRHHHAEQREPERHTELLVEPQRRGSHADVLRADRVLGELHGDAQQLWRSEESLAAAFADAIGADPLDIVPRVAARQLLVVQQTLVGDNLQRIVEGKNPDEIYEGAVAAAAVHPFARRSTWSANFAIEPIVRARESLLRREFLPMLDPANPPSSCWRGITPPWCESRSPKPR